MKWKRSFHLQMAGSSIHTKRFVGASLWIYTKSVALLSRILQNTFVKGMEVSAEGILIMSLFVKRK